MGQREAANDPDPERIPTDEEYKKWLASRNGASFRQCPPGYHEINIGKGQPFYGRWLLQYFDLALGRRYSIGRTPDGKFFVLCLYDSDRHTTIDWFPDQEAIYHSLNIPKHEWSSIVSFANKE